MAAVDQLMERLSWEYESPQVREWEVLEAELGVEFPADYKYFMSKFPSGVFRDFLSVVNPIESEEAYGEFVWNFNDMADVLRGWREHDPGRLPYPIPPDPSGIVLWGGGIDGESFFLVPGGTSLSGYGVAYCDNDFSHWGEFAGSFSEFILKFANGEISSDFLDFEALADEQIFRAEGMHFQ